MVRVSLISAAFLAVTIAIVLVQPGKARRAVDEAPPVVEVTRGAGADLSQVASVGQEPRVRLAQEVGTDPLQDAMRLLAVPAPDAKMTAPEPRRAEKPPVASVDESTRAQDDTARHAVVASSGGGLEQMILGAMRQGQSEGYIDAMVNGAAETGAVDVPSTFLTAEGRVDTASILSALSAPAGPRIPESYTVGMGDTLAAISYRFYGTLDRQADIRAANPGLAGGALTSGQVIALPRP